MKKSNAILKAILGLIILFFCSTKVFSQDVYEIKFTAGFTQYRAALAMYSGGNGVMRVRYYNNGSTRMVEETIRFQRTTAGYRLTGYSPVYPGTSIRYPGYNADNFYISQNEHGTLSCINIDDDGTTSACSIRLITGYYDKNAFLSDFNWKL